MDKKLVIVLGCFLVLMQVSFVLASSTASYYFDTTLGNDTEVTLSYTITSETALLQVATDQETDCKYSSTAGVPYDLMEGSFDLDLETVHKETLQDLGEGLHNYYVKCKNPEGNVSSELRAKFSVSLPVTASISLEEDSPISIGTYEVFLTSSKSLVETPSLSYSYDGISYDPLPLVSSGNGWQGYLIIEASVGEKVGSFKFQGKDLEGNTGTEITSGGLFIVDAEKPETIVDLSAEGQEGKVELNWYLEEDLEEYKIYRSKSRNVEHSDYYKTVTATNEFYVDTNVELGETYYYRITGIDEAGNEGDLSIEVSSTTLLEEAVETETGLDIALFGLVDNLLIDVDAVDEDARQIKEDFLYKTDEEVKIYEKLGLEVDINDALSELGNLRNEIERYKEQSLSESELNKKLGSSALKLNTIEKKIPESILVKESKTVVGFYDENDVLSTALSINPGYSNKQLDYIEDKIKEAEKDYGFAVNREGYNVEILYLDGTKKQSSVIIGNIETGLEKDRNLSILEIIPSSIASDSSDLEIEGNGYEILKEDLVLSFLSETKEIVYSIDGHIPLADLEEIKTTLYAEPTVVVEDLGGITGYFSFVGNSEGENGWAILLGIIVVSALAGYLFVLRKGGDSEAIAKMQGKITEIEDHMAGNRREKAGEIYALMAADYKRLRKEEQKVVYHKIKKLNKKLSLVSA